MNWKNRTVTYGTVLVAFTFAMTYDIPPWDKPAALIMHDHAARYISANTERQFALKSEVQLRDDIKAAEFQVYLLESSRIRILESQRLNDEAKTVELQRLQDQLDKMNKRLEKYHDQLQDLNSFWDGQYMLANKS